MNNEARRSMITFLLDRFSRLLAVWVVLAAIPNALFATWCIITAAILAGIWSESKAQTSG